MSNFCDEPFYQQNIYTNTYSLWENSAYYDINNLSPQNFSSSWHRGNDEDFETRYTSGPPEPEPSEPPDHRNRRIIVRESLYEDPKSFYHEVADDTPAPEAKEWTHLHWQKASEGPEGGPSSHNSGKRFKTNKIQKKLDKMLAKPVTISKAESMMQKMGWHGGALGRSGTGIVEPIAPNAVYATKKNGFGQNHEKTKPTQKEKREYFAMNVLYNIYEFVKNNAEIELLFDRKLRNDERARIHSTVHLMLNVDGLDGVEFGSPEQMDMVLQICDTNCYILHTQSEGEHPDRRLCIYKEAPAHVYLIIPDDLREEPPETAPDPDSKPEEADAASSLSDDNANDDDNEVEEETNPFLRSITRNLKKTKTEKIEVENQTKASRITEKIQEYFSDFSTKKEYSQFKFLGPFNEEEWNNIRDFMEKAAMYLSNEPCDGKELFEKISFEICEDVTGNAVINKIPE